MTPEDYVLFKEHVDSIIIKKGYPRFFRLKCGTVECSKPNTMMFLQHFEMAVDYREDKIVIESRSLFFRKNDFAISNITNVARMFGHIQMTDRILREHIWCLPAREDAVDVTKFLEYVALILSKKGSPYYPKSRKKIVFSSKNAEIFLNHFRLTMHTKNYDKYIDGTQFSLILSDNNIEIIESIMNHSY
jgi:hypothetical protein